MIGLSILLAVVVYVWLARFITKRIKNRITKYAVIAIFILIPTWDIIPGKLYFNHLCKNEAGVKIYKTVELPAEYWDEKGAVKFPLVKDNYISLYRENRDSRFFWIDRAVYSLNDKSGKVLVEDVVFGNWGGWVVRTFSPQNTADSCGAGSMNVVFKRTNQK